MLNKNYIFICRLFVLLVSSMSFSFAQDKETVSAFDINDPNNPDYFTFGPKINFDSDEDPYALVTSANISILDIFGKEIFQGFSVADYSIYKNDKHNFRAIQKAYLGYTSLVNDKNGTLNRFFYKAIFQGNNKELSFSTSDYFNLYLENYIARKIGIQGFNINFTSKLFNFRSFFAPQFTLKNFKKFPDSYITENDRDIERTFIAAKGQTTFSDKFRFNIYYVGMHLINGLYSDAGKSNYILEKFNYGDSIYLSDNILSIECKVNFGNTLLKLTPIFNYKKYVMKWNSNEVHKVPSVSYLASLSFNAIPFLKQNLGNKHSFLITNSLDIWSLNKNFDPAWAIDDDDDGDGNLDDNINNDNFFPYNQADNKLPFDEPAFGVIDRRLNKNNNSIVDYNEDFFLFDCDRGFYKKRNSIFGYDENHNNVVDVEENNFAPEYPYGIMNKGFQFYGNASVLNNMLNVRYALKNNESVLRPDELENLKLVSFRVSVPMKILHFNYLTQLESIKDSMPNDYFENGKVITDSLDFRNNRLYSHEFNTYRNSEALWFNLKLRTVMNQRLFDNFKISTKIAVFKIKHKFLISKFQITPMVKLERYLNNVPLGIIQNTNNSKTIDFILKQNENYRALNGIVKIKYQLLENLNIVTGYQFRNLDDNNFLRNSYRKHSVSTEIMGESKNLGNYGNRRKIAVTLGHKFNHINYYNDSNNLTGEANEKTEHNIYINMWLSM